MKDGKYSCQKKHINVSNDFFGAVSHKVEMDEHLNCHLSAWGQFKYRVYLCGEAWLKCCKAESEVSAYNECRLGLTVQIM